MQAEIKSAKIASSRSRFLSRETKKKSGARTVDPNAALMNATLLLPEPQNKVDTSGNPTGNFTYNLTLANENVKYIGHPSQFHGTTGQTHEYEKIDSKKYPNAIFGLPSYCSPEAAKQGLSSFVAPIPGEHGMIRTKCPTEVNVTNFLPVQIKGLSCKSFHMKQTYSKKKNDKKEENGNQSSATPAAAAPDPDAPVVDEGDAAKEEVEEIRETVVKYHMLDVGAFSLYPDLNGVVYFGEGLQAVVKAGLCPEIWTEINLRTNGRPEKGEEKLATWNPECRVIPMGPNMKKYMERIIPDKEFSVASYLDGKKVKDKDSVEIEYTSDFKSYSKSVKTGWIFPVEIEQEVGDYDINDPKSPPELMEMILTARKPYVYSQFGIDQRPDQRLRAETVFNLFRKYGDGFAVVGMDWAKSDALNAGDSKLNGLQNNPIAKRLDGMTQDEGKISCYAWELLALKCDFRGLVLKYGIEVSRKYAAGHLQVIQAIAKSKATVRNAGEEERVVNQCMIEHGMVPISTDPSIVSDYIPDRYGAVPVEDGGIVSVRYFLLNPAMMHRNGAKASAIISKHMANKKDEKQPEWGDHVAKLFSATSISLDKVPGCPQDIIDICTPIADSGVDSTTEHLMLYAVCFVEEWKDRDDDPLSCRRPALKILAKHYSFQPDFTFCPDKEQAIAHSQEKKEKQKQKKRKQEPEPEPEPEPVKAKTKKPKKKKESEYSDSESETEALPPKKKKKADKVKVPEPMEVSDSDEESEA